MSMKMGLQVTIWKNERKTNSMLVKNFKDVSRLPHPTKLQETAN